MIKKNITFFIITLIIFPFYTKAEDSSINENIFQEAINKNFKPIDKKAETFLVNLNKSKNLCFGPEKSLNFTECIDKIDKVFSINSPDLVLGEKGYAKACEKALIEVIEKQENKRIGANKAITILDKNSNNRKSCYEIYEFKLKIFKSVAYDILQKNKAQILKDEQKKYNQELRKKYDNLLDLFRINLGYIERLWKKWPSKTKK